MRGIDLRPCAPVPCPCGSGLRRARCCELDYASLESAEAIRHLLPLAEQDSVANRRGNSPLCLELHDLAPGQPDALAVPYAIHNQSPP